MEEIPGKRIRIVSGVRQVVHELTTIKQAVKEIDSGTLTIYDAAKKYEVSRTTVNTWMRKYSTGDEAILTERAQTPIEIRRQTVWDIEQGLITKKEAAKKLRRDYSTITMWMGLYSCNPKINPKQMEELASQEQRSTELVKQENAGLRLGIKELQLKVAGLETMIDLAEKEYNVPIRKKSGTKQ